jgi:hypothetical protein
LQVCGFKVPALQLERIDQEERQQVQSHRVVLLMLYFKKRKNAGEVQQRLP